MCFISLHLFLLPNMKRPWKIQVPFWQVTYIRHSSRGAEVIILNWAGTVGERKYTVLVYFISIVLTTLFLQIQWSIDHLINICKSGIVELLFRANSSAYQCKPYILRVSWLSYGSNWGSLFPDQHWHLETSVMEVISSVGNKSFHHFHGGSNANIKMVVCIPVG